MATALTPDPRYIGQIFPSNQSLGPNVPVCPPNATRFIQDADWKDAKKGAMEIGRILGHGLTLCERELEWMTRQPDNVLAGWNQVQPEELEAAFTRCTKELDSVPAIPEYDDPWLAGAAAEGFDEGYGNGVDEVMNRVLALELAVAVVEVAVLAGLPLIEVAATRGMRMSLVALRRMPVFVPVAAGGGGAFMKGAPRIAARIVAEGSSRVLGRNLKLAGLIRLPGEFAHHIVAHGDHRAKQALGILKKFGINVDEAVNGVYLPGYKTSPNPLGKIVHGNLHTNAYYEAVEAALTGASSKAEVIRRLRFIAWKLEHGIML